MKITILGCGTSTGVPVPGCECAVCTSGSARNQRLRTSALVSLDSGQNILIDVSTDFRAQALRASIKKINAVLFTHAHADHTNGLDDLRPYNFLLKRSIPCYGSPLTLKDIRSRFSYVFEDDGRYLGGSKPKLDLVEIDEASDFVVEGETIQPFSLMHGRTPVTGYRIGKLGYATDFKEISERGREILKGVKILILDGLRYESHATHLTIPEAIDLSRELKAEKTYLVHMTHTIDYEEVMEKLPPEVELAYDGLEVSV